MTDEPYADPALRAALGSLLLDEPPSPSVLDDVARGRAHRRRRRARAGSVVALVALMLGAVAVVGLPRPLGTGQPASGSAAASAEEALDVAKARLEPYLRVLGWTIVADNRPTMPEGSDHAVMSLGVVRSAGLDDDDPLVTELRVLTYPAAPLQGDILAGCSPTTCTAVPAVVDDCSGTPDCSTTTGARPKASVGRLDWGSLILDRTFRSAGSGQLLELVVGEDPAPPTVAALGPEPFLDDAQARALLDAVGNPFVAGTGPAPPPARASGLRGDRVQEFTCPTARRYAPRGDSPQPVTGAPLEMVLCGAVVDVARKDPVLVTGAEGEALTDLVTALSQPDDLVTLRGCPMTMKIQPIVLVRTTDGAWMVRLPVDVCDQMLRSVGDAIDAARATGVPGPAPS